MMADTGDIEHGPGSVITVFKTPGTFTLTPVLKEWLRVLVDKLTARGYTSGSPETTTLVIRAASERPAFESLRWQRRWTSSL